VSRRDPLKAIATILTMVVAIAVLAAGGYLFWEHLSTANKLAEAQRKAGAATVDAGQARAETAAQKIIVAGETRQHLDLAIHQDNANAIAAAPGADAPLDPGLIAAANFGLCRYPANAADPRCAGLQPAHPAVVSEADPLGGAAVDH
jgi:hypothetical protein